MYRQVPLLLSIALFSSPLLSLEIIDTSRFCAKIGNTVNRFVQRENSLLDELVETALEAQSLRSELEKLLSELNTLNNLVRAADIFNESESGEFESGSLSDILLDEIDLDRLLVLQEEISILTSDLSNELFRMREIQARLQTLEDSRTSLEDLSAVFCSEPETDLVPATSVDDPSNAAVGLNRGSPAVSASGSSPIPADDLGEVNIPEKIAWTDAWNISVKGTISRPHIANGERESGLYLTLRDDGTVMNAQLGVGGGLTRCSDAGGDLKNVYFEGWYEHLFKVQAGVKVTGPITADYQYPVNVTARFVEQRKSGDSLETVGSGSYQGSGMMKRVGNTTGTQSACK